MFLIGDDMCCRDDFVPCALERWICMIGGTYGLLLMKTGREH